MNTFIVMVSIICLIVFYRNICLMWQSATWQIGLLRLQKSGSAALNEKADAAL